MRVVRRSVAPEVSFLLLVVFLFVGKALSQFLVGPIQNPTNNHFYAITTSFALTWTEWKAAVDAETFVLDNSIGYLCTITDAGEESWRHANNIVGGVSAGFRIPDAYPQNYTWAVPAGLPESGVAFYTQTADSAGTCLTYCNWQNTEPTGPAAVSAQNVLNLQTTANPWNDVSANEPIGACIEFGELCVTGAFWNGSACVFPPSSTPSISMTASFSASVTPSSSISPSTSTVPSPSSILATVSPIPPSPSRFRSTTDGTTGHTTRRRSTTGKSRRGTTSTTGGDTDTSDASALYSPRVLVISILSLMAHCLL